MPTNQRGSTARQSEHQLTHFLRKTVTFADVFPAAGIPMGYIPAGALIVGASIDVTTAFNAGTTNSLSVGTNTPTNDNIVTAAQAVAGTQGVKRNLAPTVRVDQITTDSYVYVSYAQSGTAASAGQATIVVEFIPNIDL